MAKKLDKDDRAIWQKVADTVTPLIRQHLAAAALDSSKPATSSSKKTAQKKDQQKTATPGSGKTASRNLGAMASPAAPPIAPAITPPGPADLNSHRYGGISRSNARQIKSGQAEITARIDLHGKTRDQAMTSLRSFLNGAARAGHRTVLVITGKGTGGNGVIRRSLPVWLNEEPLASLVIAYSEAQPKDGGSGAFYVRLRRP